ncbi:MAG: hypothetical protein ABIJ23_04935 [Candidatus Magasanikbacteria bacterium]
MISWLSYKVNQKFDRNIIKSKQKMYLMFSFLFLFFVVFYVAIFSLVPSGNIVDITQAGGTANWIGVSGGDWGTGTNWDIGVVPTSTTIVNISSSTAITVNVTANISFDTLNIGGSSALNTLVLTADITEGIAININNNGIIQQKNSNTQTITGDLTINSGGKLTHTDNSTSQLYKVDFSVANAIINSGGFVNVNGLGFDGSVNEIIDGYGTGGGQSTGDDLTAGGGGAGHFGNGGSGQGSFAGGVGYGDISSISTIGSGGGSAYNNALGGSGGGLIILNASGDITISGAISATGSNGAVAIDQANGAGGGAGGGIKLVADSFIGTPTSLTAIGGNGGDSTRDGGGGGGGGVYLEYTTANSINYSGVNMYGGVGEQYGGAGVLLIKQIGGNTDLYSINQAVSGADTIQGTTSLSIDSLTLASSSIYIVTSTKSLTISSTTLNSVIDATGILEITGGTLVTPTTLNVNSTTLRFWQTSTWADSETVDLNINNSAILDLCYFNTTTSALVLDDLVVNSGGTITHGAHTDLRDEQTHIVKINANNITINLGGTVTADAKGYAGGYSEGGDGYGLGPGLGGSVAGPYIGSGGAHCGDGADTDLDGGILYCERSSPITMGSGGGGDYSGNYGGSGGGLIQLVATSTINISGIITADGGNGEGGWQEGAGGGAGGAISISAVTISGTPTSLSVSGGDGGVDSYNSANNGGGGGGGLLYIAYIYPISITTSSPFVDLSAGSFGTGAGVGALTTVSNNNLPIATAISPYQSSSSYVTVTTTVSDTDSDVTSLTLQYSLDNSAWATSTLGTVIPSFGTVSTTNGSITGIDTDATSSVGLTIKWNIETDITNTDDTTVYFRLTPNDGIDDGTTVSSSAFAVDTKDPTTPGDLTVNTLTNSSVILNFGTTTTDTNFSEYKIFYKEGASGVDVTDSALTSSTDSNLGNVLYGGASTTTISGLSANTQYVANIVAYDLWDGIGVATEFSFYTLASTLSSVSALTNSASQITISWSGDATQYYVENITAGTNSGWTSASSYAFTSLTANTLYSFRVKAKNAGGTETSWSSTVSATTQSSGVPIPSPPPPPPPKPDPQCLPGDLSCQPDPENPSGLVIINNGDSFTLTRDVSVCFLDLSFVNKYLLSEDATFSDVLNYNDLPAGQSCVNYSITSQGDGKKTIYARLLNQSKGTVYNTSDVINLVTAPPTGKVTINNGDAKTSSNIVILKAYEIKNANYFAYSIKNIFTSFPGVTVGSTKQVFVTLPKGQYGEKTIYVRLKNEFGDTFLSDSINYVPAPDEEEPELPPEEPTGPEQPTKPEVPVPDQPNPTEPDGGSDDSPSDQPAGGSSNPTTPPTNPISPVLPTTPIVDEEINTKPSFTEKAIAKVTEKAPATTLVVQKTIKTIQKFTDNPQVEATNEQIIAPVIAGAGVANVIASVAVGGFQIPQMLLFLRYLFTQPLLLLRLRKRKDWGIVYNSFTKQPLDLATVRIIDTLSNRVVSSQVTDSQGRYLISIIPGTYKLEITKPGFASFSSHLAEAKEDSKFINLYHGEEISISEPSAINYNIPIDPEDRKLTTLQVIKEHTIKSTQSIIALTGLIITLISFTISPTAIIATFFFLHLLFYSMFYRFSHIDLPATWGKVVEKLNQKPLGKVVIRVFDSAYNKLVETGVTDHKGRYAVLVGPSKYFITYDKPGFQEKKSPELDYSSTKTQGMGGIVNRSETMERKQNMESTESTELKEDKEDRNDK